MNVRKAHTGDAAALFALNEAFNGKSDITIQMIADSLENNGQENVFVAEADGLIVGFCCVQLFQSFCYGSNYAEITELFVEEAYRKQGIGASLTRYAENFYKGQNVAGFQLFTGGGNITAQRFYEEIGYSKTNEIMYRKRDLK